MLQICANIKNAREAKGITQQEIADIMGIDRNTYKNWEDKTEPKLSTIKTIAEILDIPAISLLHGVIDVPASDLIKAGGIRKESGLKEARQSLTQLVGAIGQLSGLSKDEFLAFFPDFPSGNIGPFEDWGNKKGKKSGKSSSGRQV
jgi:transcriptional regulator with XRE-family HTH domain